VNVIGDPLVEVLPYFDRSSRDPGNLNEDDVTRVLNAQVTTQLPKRAFIAKHLNIGSGAARPDTTSSGKALNGDFTNTAHQRSTRPTIAFALWQIAMGVVSKTDENGNFIVEACGQPNMKMARHFLEWQRPEKWGKRRKRHVPHNAGVLVIGGDVTKKPEYDTTASVKARKWKSFSRKFREAKT
jgi:hypothetical protein